MVRGAKSTIGLWAELLRRGAEQLRLRNSKETYLKGCAVFQLIPLY